MEATSWKVAWSPHKPNEFIRYCNEIFLYKTASEDDMHQKTSGSKQQVMKLSDDMSGTVVAIKSEVSSIKEISWCRRPDAQHLLAIGQPNGHVVLANLGHEVSATSSHLLGLELAPRSDRMCNDLAWNPVEHNLLAVALDKVRNDHSLLIWDVESTPTLGTKSHHGRHSRSEAPPMMTPSIKNGLSETTVSVAWFPSQSKTLVAGQGQKFLRIYDLRDQGKLVSFGVTNCKAMNGVCVDPYNDYRFASFAEGAQGPVLVWDTRNFKEPVITLPQVNQTKQISKISWCPTRRNLLGTLFKNSPVIKLTDLMHLPSENFGSFSPVMDDEREVVILERKIQPTKATLSSFSWHPTHHNIMLTSSTSGNVNYVKVFERISLCWSPGNGLVWGCGSNMLNCSENADVLPLDCKDTSTIMRERAQQGYGEKSVMKDLQKLKDILKDPVLVKLWTWLKHVRKPKDQDTRKGRKFFGVKSIIKGEANMSGKCEKGQIDEQTRAASPSIAVPYVSEDRKLALQLCRWDFTGNSLNEHISRLEQNGEYERAAATALFNNQMRLAINILSGRNIREIKSDNGPREQAPPPDPSMNVVAMALSGYSPENKRSLWREMCANLSPQLKNPYLRGVFSFLTQDDDSFNSILRETGIQLEDRVAFACKYLPDAMLASYIDNLTAAMVEEGHLEGLLLTGLTSDGLNLLEKYVTKTSDVQTTSLIIVNTKVTEALRDPRVTGWLESYRDLLDCWRLWHQRAKLDSFIYGAESGRKVPNQICISCNYCGKPVSANFFNSGVHRLSRYPGASSSRPKVMACPSCRRPLPRCAVCLINMGTPSSHMQRQGGSKPRNDFQQNPFDNWFTWCQNCKHGGHALHLIEWFREERECPVTGCCCFCNSQDGVCQLSSKETGGAD